MGRESNSISKLETGYNMKSRFGLEWVMKKKLMRQGVKSTWVLDEGSLKKPDFVDVGI